jgi:hypothetical protein
VGLPKLSRTRWHGYRRKWATERKHYPLKDVAAADRVLGDDAPIATEAPVAAEKLREKRHLALGG